ncbi:xanthine dehydrogenase family protein molybdopterin-binding subunit [Actinoplanes sp. NPDC051470]|uniref:xanthine dehydrogenase family protein molybdopterin-binding subunit n=1 Tax=Actinoplanes sp. NPDC051470 TaxID=3157224 RepID=UPI003438B0D7
MTTALEKNRTAPAPTKNVGRSIDRVDGIAKVSGGARFSAEVPYADIAHAALVHASIPRGRVTGIDTTAAEAVPGVLKVLTHQNAPKMIPSAKPSIMDLSTMAPGTPINYLNTDEVHWNGQPVAVVVAETLEAAHAAARLVEVSYESRPAVTDFAVAQDHPKPVKGSLIEVGEVKTGDAEQALAAAPVAVDLRYTTPGQNHNALEPHATTAAWDGDRLTVHDATQNIDWVRKHLARRFGVPVAGVRVIAEFIGGGFGGKGSVWAGTVLTALAAKVTGRPVRMALTREAVNRTVGGRAPTVQRVALGAQRDGTLTALVHTGVSQVGRAGGGVEPVASQSQYLYAAPAILVRHSTAEVDALPNTYMRAPGEAMGSFALESAIDELAVELGLDPLELRARNEPERNPTGRQRFSRRDLRAVYARGAREFGWSGRDPKPRSMRDGRWLVGWGVAAALHLPVHLGGDVLVRLRADGTVLVRSGLQEIGVGVATVVAQVTADALGVPVGAVTVELGDSEQPTAPGAAGSTQTSSATAAVLQACEQLKRSMLGLVRRSSPPLRDATFTDGGLFRADGAGRSYSEILGDAGLPSIEARTGSDSRLGQAAGQVRMMTRFLADRRRWVHPATGAHFCEVRVDPDTAEVRVTRWLGIFDVGRVLNPKLASSQLRGGVVMGIGAALTEETLVDPRSGRIMNPGLGEYHVPVHADVPRIDIGFIDEPDPTTPLGLLGVGEVGITGVAAAVANAVHHATGVRVRELPLTLDRLL